MTLYLIETSGLGDFYVLSDGTTNAELKLSKMLDKADYGFSKDRAIVSIKIIAHEILEFPKGRPNFSSGNRLII